MRRMDTKSAVIFDFDGTIVDSMNAFADIASKVMPKRLDIDPETARRLYFETSGLPFFQQLEAIFPGDPANRETAEEYERLKLEGYFEEPLFDDALDTVKNLRERGLRVAVSSNNFQHLVDEFVEKKGMEFDMVLGFKDGFAKGADHFRHLEQSFRIPKTEIVFVGDSMKDGERAHQYGVNFIAKEGIFTRNEFEARFPSAMVISNLSELREIF
jgi:phosphoglycolate phosphatase-like HAD superfamily hydrolase